VGRPSLPADKLARVITGEIRPPRWSVRIVAQNADISHGTVQCICVKNDLGLHISELSNC
jgi:hypothetical protein